MRTSGSGVQLNQYVLRKSKRGGGYGRWPAYETAFDSFGRWLFSPAGTAYWGQSRSGRITEWEVGRPANMIEGVAELWLVPEDTWWVAKWDEMNGVRGIHVDICTPAQHLGKEWSFVDLKLDAFWHSDGRIGIADEDEFVDACRAGLVSEPEAAAARTVAQEVLQWLHDGVEPFGLVGWERFETATKAGLSPLSIAVAQSDAETETTRPEPTA